MNQFLRLILFSFTLVLFSFKIIQNDTPFKKEQLKDPAILVKVLNDPKAIKPYIYNVGPMQLIKGAINIGPGASLANQDKFEYEVGKIAKDKEIIIYCGCCKLKTCPNITPIFDYLISAGYKKSYILNLPENLQQDWIDKGYPMAKK